ARERVPHELRDLRVRAPRRSLRPALPPGRRGGELPLLDRVLRRPPAVRPVPHARLVAARAVALLLVRRRRRPRGARAVGPGARRVRAGARGRRGALTFASRCDKKPWSEPCGAPRARGKVKWVQPRPDPAAA